MQIVNDYVGIFLMLYFFCWPN